MIEYRAFKQENDNGYNIVRPNGSVVCYICNDGANKKSINLLIAELNTRTTDRLVDKIEAMRNEFNNGFYEAALVDVLEVMGVKS